MLTKLFNRNELKNSWKNLNIFKIFKIFVIKLLVCFSPDWGRVYTLVFFANPTIIPPCYCHWTGNELNGRNITSDITTPTPAAPTLFHIYMSWSSLKQKHCQGRSTAHQESPKLQTRMPPCTDNRGLELFTSLQFWKSIRN